MKNKKFFNSFKYAFEGMFSAFSSERNMKIHFLIMILVILFGVLCKINMVEWIICVLCFVMVIGAELFNTSIEFIVDMISPEKNIIAKKIKDLSAGAVLTFALGAAVIGLIIFLPKLLELFA